MRTLACFLAVLLMTASAHAQDEPSDSAGPREGISIGAVAIPALEGGGPWFMPAIRLSAPLGAKVGVDIDAGRVFGASSRVLRHSQLLRWANPISPDAPADRRGREVLADWPDVSEQHQTGRSRWRGQSQASHGAVDWPWLELRLRQRHESGERNRLQRRRRLHGVRERRRAMGTTSKARRVTTRIISLPPFWNSYGTS